MTGKNIVIFLTLLTLTIAEEIATENTIAEDVGDASGVVRVCVTWCEYVYLSLLISCQYRIGQDLYGISKKESPVLKNDVNKCS